jgi:hypothetical protein
MIRELRGARQSREIVDPCSLLRRHRAARPRRFCLHSPTRHGPRSQPRTLQHRRLHQNRPWKAHQNVIMFCYQYFARIVFSAKRIGRRDDPGLTSGPKRRRSPLSRQRQPVKSGPLQRYIPGVRGCSRRLWPGRAFKIRNFSQGLIDQFLKLHGRSYFSHPLLG